MSTKALYPCPVCLCPQTISLLGDHLRQAHGIAVHGCDSRRKRPLPDRYITALCDGAVRARLLIAKELRLHGD